jgi:hypothetical protein
MGSHPFAASWVAGLVARRVANWGAPYPVAGEDSDPEAACPVADEADYDPRAAAPVAALASNRRVPPLWSGDRVYAHVEGVQTLVADRAAAGPGAGGPVAARPGAAPASNRRVPPL